MKARAILFLFIFVSFLVIPSIVLVINHQVDVAYVFSLAEEESKKSKEVELYTELKNHPLSIVDFFSDEFFEYGNQPIKPVYLSVISPPPKFLLSR